MPTLTRWYVKTALVYFIVALGVAVLLAARNLLRLPPLVDTLGPPYLHLLLIGWMTQLIMGIVFWMFPKYSREQPRHSEGAAWAVYAMLNIGLLLRAIGEPANTLRTERVWDYLLLISAMLQWLAGLVFVANTWGRVKER
jgi:hypothetical protein